MGSLGGGNAVRLAPPVDLQLVARDIASSAQVPLLDGALAQTDVVSLPVIAEPTNAKETFPWLVAVEEDGEFLGYMRHPSTFDPKTNTLVFELSGKACRPSACCRSCPGLPRPGKCPPPAGSSHRLRLYLRPSPQSFR